MVETLAPGGPVHELGYAAEGRGLEVLLALDDTVLAARLARVLRADDAVGRVVTAATPWLGALLARDAPPHVAVVEFASDLERSRRAARMLTTRTGLVGLVGSAPECLLAAAKSGAAAVVGRGATSADEITVAVHKVAGGAATIAPSIAATALGALRRMPTPREAATGPTRLTPREVDVMAHVVRGRTNAEIAVSLGLRPKTVKNHVSRILCKLGTPNRAAAMAAWLDVG